MREGYGLLAFLFCNYFFRFFLWDNMELWISFWRLETDRVARSEDMTTLLATTTEDVSTISSDSSSEESVFSETSAFFEFTKHNKKMRDSGKEYEDCIEKRAKSNVLFLCLQN